MELTETIATTETAANETALTATTPETTSTEISAEHEHTHDHDHSGHNHEVAPTLNPELMREIEVEVPADEVSKSYKTVIKRYQKLARIPGFRAGKVPETLVRPRFM